MAEESQPKIIAFYLPQFHQIPENDKWWGTGFTEWTNTKKTLPLYPGHNQPREPYSDYYYDLTDPKAREWQAKIAKEHGIYGFCYYHYWFNGKMLLETPLNEILRTKKPDFPFCLSWANEHWTRRWDGGNQDILMAQEYGGEQDWENHFTYLLNAFKDPRYIRIENKPLFILYRPVNIPRCEEMLQYWDTLAKKNGLEEGLYFAEQLNTEKISSVPRIDANIEFEPLFTLHHDPQTQHTNEAYKQNYLFMPNYLAKYDFFWNQIINRNLSLHDRKTFLGAFSDWDNSPRMGGNSLIFCDVSAEKFGYYLSCQIKKAQLLQSPFIFINAWNEWAEGAYLEPDKKNGYAFLEAVQKAIGGIKNQSTDCQQQI